MTEGVLPGKQAFRFSRKLYRYAKGPIPEGAVAVGDWGSFNVLALSVTYGDSSPKGRASGETGGFAILSVTFPLCQGLSLWERWHGVSRDGEGEPVSPAAPRFRRKRRCNCRFPPRPFL